MDIGERQNVRDDQTSDCRRFGSHYRNSQSRKISIGIMVDSTLKANSEYMNEKEVTVANAEKLISSKENTLEEGKKVTKEIKSPITGKQVEAPEQEKSPWVSTRSKSPAVNTVHQAKENSNLPANSDYAQNKFVRENNLTKGHSAQFVEKDTSNFQARGDKQKKFNRVTYKRNAVGDGTTDRLEEFSFATAREDCMPDKGVIEDTTNKPGIKSSDALKMKLWEILGTISSPTKQFSNSWPHEPDAKSSKLEKVCEVKGDTVVNSRQNSDTIETDSEKLDPAVKRPATRSLTRKRAPSKVQQKKARTVTSTRLKQKNQDKNIFCFQEGLVGEQSAVNGGSSISKTKTKNEIMSSKTEPWKISFTEKYNKDKISLVSDLKKVPVPGEKTSSFGSRMENFCTSPPQATREYVEPKNLFPEKNVHESPVARNTVQVRQRGSPKLQENANQSEDHGNPFLNNIMDQQDDLLRPEFGTKSPSIRSSSCSPFNACSPALVKGIFTVDNIRSFKTWQTSKPTSNTSDAQNDSYDDEDLKESPVRNLTPSMEEKYEELPESPSQERDCASSGDDSPIIGGYNGCTEDEVSSPKKAATERPKSIHDLVKRLRIHGGFKLNEFSPISRSHPGTNEDNEFCEPSEPDQDDGLYRAVTLFALALERLQNKVKSVTRQKSSEILMLAVDGINLHTQNVESQIQADIGKLTSLSKAKRKRLETRFQEDQEKLKLIHEKFKQELNQHLQDCCSTLEGFEENKIEFKGTIDRQKASHRKLLLQVEEAIEFQLNDAEQKITTVHKVANERMLSLKKVIAECLMEGVLD